jgi:ribosome-associated protein
MIQLAPTQLAPTQLAPTQLAVARIERGWRVASVDTIRIAPGVEVPATELSWRFSASGGAGGQHVNTSNTRAEVIWDIAASPSITESVRERLIGRLGPVLSVTASDRRSQLRNRELAVDRLVERARDALHEPATRRPTRPTLASKRRRLETKRRQGERKQQRRGGWDDS